MSFNPEPFDALAALIQWGMVFGIITVSALVLALLGALVIYGSAGPKVVLQHLVGGMTDFIRMSPRRVWAIVGLTIKESYRRKTLMVFVIFVVLFMFGGWFMPTADVPSELLIPRLVGFVFKAITFLLLPVVLLLSCWGVPEDIRLRSLHTVVTKPVRRSEIVIGRILGFTIVGTLVIAVMGVVGYVWIIRQVPPDGQRLLVSRVPILGSLAFRDSEGNATAAGVNVGDIWTFRSYIEGGTSAKAIWTFEEIDADRLGGKLVLESDFEAFRTHKGTMGKTLFVQYTFERALRERIAAPFELDGNFRPVASRLKAGEFPGSADELVGLANAFDKGEIKLSSSTRRRLADAIEHEFVGVFAPFDQDPQHAKWASAFVESAEQVGAAIRKSDDRSCATALKRLAKAIRNHESSLEEYVVDLRVATPSFEVEEYHGNVRTFERNLSRSSRDSDRVDLFDDLVHGGRLRVEVACLDVGQYLGMARPDLFVQLPNRPFRSGYSKAIGGVWLMMILVIVLGVTASCFLKAPIAAVLTLVLFLLGSVAHGFMTNLVEGKIAGSGATESIVRILTQKNQTVDLEESVGTRIMRGVDKPITIGVSLMYHIIPNFESYQLTRWVAYGFDVPFGTALVPCLFTTLAFFVPCVFLGYYALKLRELESK